jgi:hypothetical protein
MHICQAQGRLAIDRALLGIRAECNQLLQQSATAQLCGEMQRGHAGAVSGVGIHAQRQQGLAQTLPAQAHRQHDRR